MKNPEGESLDTHHSVRRLDTSAFVSVVSSCYQLVQHREVAEAVHAIGERLERPGADVPRFAGEHHFPPGA